MLLATNVILLLVGLANVMPSEILTSRDINNLLRKKRDNKNQDSFDLSYGSRSDIPGYLTYTRRLRRDDAEEQIPLAEDADYVVRGNRDYKNQISFDVRRASRGTPGMTTYTRRFRRYAPLAENADYTSRQKRHSKNQLNFELRNGRRSGTLRVLTYPRRFRRYAPEKDADEEAREKRDWRKKISFILSHDSRYDTREMLPYTRRYRRNMG